jgi:hypothetical protein
MRKPSAGIHAHVRLHAEIPLIALLSRKASADRACPPRSWWAARSGQCDIDDQIGRGQIVKALVLAQVIVVGDERLDLGLELAGQASAERKKPENLAATVTT